LGLSRLRAQQSVAMGHGNRLRAAVNAELGQNVLNMGRDRLRANEELLRDLRLTETVGEQSQDFSFTPRELWPLSRRAGRSGARDEAAHASDQLVGREGLDHIVVGPEEQTPGAVERFDPLAGD